jgi:SAM-dependent methyltransferase
MSGPGPVDRAAAASDARYADGRYLDDNPGWHEQDSAWKAAQIQALLRRRGLQPRSVCEIGCGAGGILQALQGALGPGVSFDGYEVSPQAHELCRGKAAPGLRFHHADLLADEAKDAAGFDLMLAIDVFEHVDDPIGFLRRLRGRGRHTIFHIPLDLSVQTVLRATPLQRLRDQVGHLHYYTRDTALATLGHAGYTVLDHAYTAWSLELPSRSWKDALARLPRRLAYAMHRDLAVRVLGGFSLLVLAQ